MAKAEPGLQAERKKAIDQMIATRVFHKLDARPGRYPDLAVGPGFAGLPFEDKQLVAAIVLSYCRGEYPDDPHQSTVFLVDWRNRKELGTMSADRGLALK